MNNLLEIPLGKYHYTFTKEGKQLITRNGEPWRDETGDNLICTLAHHLQEAWEELELAREIIEDSGIDFEEALEMKRGEVN